MKINKIEIDGFKGIGELAIEPKNFNVIIGKNNTSKSSLLEAIGYAILLNRGLSFNNLFYNIRTVLRGMRRPVLSHIINVKKKEANITIKLENDTKTIRFYRPEEVEAIKKSKKQIMEDFELLLNTTTESGLKNGKSDEKKQKNNSKKIKDDLDELGKLIDKIFSDDKQFPDIAKGCIFLEKQGGSEFLTRYPDSNSHLPKPLDEWLGSRGYDFFDLRFLRRKIHRDSDYSIDKGPISFIETSDPFSFRMLPVQNVDRIQTYLQQSGLLDDIGKLRRFDRTLLFRDKNGKEFDIPCSQMGEGFKSLVNILAKINKDSKIILLEELETHMHPEYVKAILSKLIDFSKTRDMQFFITTHNFDILDFLVSDSMKSDRQEYLDKELKIIRMENIRNEITSTQFDRESAKPIINDINDDLRGS